METKNKSNFRVKVNAQEVFYYSLIQAGRDLISNIILANTGEEVINNIKLKIEFAYGFVENIEIEVGNLNAGSFIEITPKLIFDNRKVFELTEKFIDTMKITFYSNEEVLEEYISKTAFLPTNQ